VYTAVGLAAGNLVHATYCLVGIGVIISQSILLFNASSGSARRS
jgi:threonine/homoserine/homoserine lactone efflux protein